ncbi:hypothetical protein Leryth_005764 [Lithospermum erythrorhizon]|nr:hypothetical protein Leryth_005764 [Lithospermum erythrorhizon]
MEHWVHIRRSDLRKTIISWKECGTPVRSDDRFPWYSSFRRHCQDPGAKGKKISNMKASIPFSQKFPHADPLALKLLQRLIAFDPKDRPSAEEALADPYFQGMSTNENIPSAQPISKLEFDFERRKLAKDDVRELIYREILEYHPKMLEEYLEGGEQTSGFMYPSGVDRFKRQFAHLEELRGKGEKGTPPLQRQHVSLPRERVPVQKDEKPSENIDVDKTSDSNEISGHSPHSLLKSASISASKCVEVEDKKDTEDEVGYAQNEDVDDLAAKVVSLHAS